LLAKVAFFCLIKTKMLPLRLPLLLFFFFNLKKKNNKEEAGEAQEEAAGRGYINVIQ
jgi:hypothetical protein